MKAAISAAEPIPAEATRVRRSRHFNRAGRLVTIVLLLIAAFAGFAVFLAAAVALLVTDQRQFGYYALAGLGVTALARFIVFILARSLSCSLCYGTVMQEKRCQKHRDAFKLPLLSHRASAVASAACTGTFRCMYCGTPYRLRK